MLGPARRGCRATAARCAAGLLAVPLALGGCTGDDEPADDDGAQDAAEPEQVPPRLVVPEEPTTLVTGDGAAALAAATSAALFEHAPVVVVAPEDDLGAQAQAASAAVGLGVPLLLTPSSTEAGAAADEAAAAPPAPLGTTSADELARLTPQGVLAFGSPAARWAQRQGGEAAVVTAPGDPDALRSFGQLELGEAQAVPAGRLAASAAALERERPPLLTLEAGSAPDAGSDPEPAGDGEGAGAPGSAPSGAGDLPALASAEPLDDLLVLVEHDDAGIAAVATARASGAQVVTVAGGDPRADRTAIAALAAAPLPEHVMALGSGFGPADRLRQRLEVAATGVELPGGGQVLFPHRRLVALYGHPGAPVLGVLGEQPVDAAVARAQQMAAGYEGLVGEPVVPAFEIITTVASASAGPDGDYSSESAVDDLRPWVEAAGAAGVYVVLDLQPGTTDFLTQAQRYEELLAQPHVGLALDPEWRLAPGQRHMAQIGSVGVDEVNAVAAWLAELTRERDLPQKLLLLHQFQLRMIAERGRLDTGHDELAVLVHADGFGTPGQKLDTWRALRSEPVADVWWGWKNFLDEDEPTFSPEQTVAVEPTPWFVSYQ